MKDNVVEVEGAVCIKKEYEADIDEENTVILYLGSMGECKYDSETGIVTSEYGYKTLMLGGKQPLAIYDAGIDGDKTLYYTPVYVGDEEEASLVTVSVDKDNKVTVVNRLKTANDEGFTKLANLFLEVADVEKHHEERYRALIDNINNDEVFKKDYEEAWECRNCGHIHYGKDAPNVCPVCAKQQAFFQIYPENY